eukprot:Clim_evm15s223 gene=Clim_evmTU15s223
MSMRDLVDGGCGTSNPLMKLVDKAQARDGMPMGGRVGSHIPGQPGMMQPSMQRPQMSQADQQRADAFMKGKQPMHAPRGPMPMPQAQAGGAPLRQMGGAPAQAGWAQEFGRQQNAGPAPSAAWDQEFMAGRGKQAAGPGPSAMTSGQRAYIPPMEYGMHAPHRPMAMMNQQQQMNRPQVAIPPDWQQEFNKATISEQPAQQEKYVSTLSLRTQERSIDSNTNRNESAIASLLSNHSNQDAAQAVSAENEELAKTAGKLVNAVGDDKLQQSEFMDFMRKLSRKEVTFENNKLVENPGGVGVDWAAEFATKESIELQREIDNDQEDAAQITNNPAPNLFSNSSSLGAVTSITGAAQQAQDWVKEFTERQENGSTAETLDIENDFTQQYQEYLQNIAAVDDDLDFVSEFQNQEQSTFDQIYDTQNDMETEQEYKFREENPYEDSADPFAEGMERLRRGELLQAIMAFEAAVKLRPDNAAAWYYLGNTQAEYENDVAAIRALERCLQLQPDNSHARMALAVSYTNETNYTRAYDNLEQWVRTHPDYAKLVEDMPASTLNDGSGGPGMVAVLQRQEKIMDMYLRAVRNSGQSFDPDLQIGLGVLFNITGEYDKAVECFNSALDARPDDFYLWNKLGATLANSHRSEEAVAAYHRALELRPNFVRARFNLGISCINLNAHKEAAEHFMSTLQIQQQQSEDAHSQSPITSRSIWDMLRMTFYMMNRPDLAEKVDLQDLRAYRAEFDF